MPLRYVPYDRSLATPNIIVDGTANIGTVLTLSHWRRSGTPVELAADTSAEIVFKYLDVPRLHVGAETVSNNHFDEDGLIGIFALLLPELSIRHRALLIDAAQAGDFGVYQARNAARIAFTILAYRDEETSPLPKSIFRLRYPDHAAELYRETLQVLPGLLDDLEAYRPLWEKSDRELTESEKLVANGSVSIEEWPDLDLAIVRLPANSTVACHPFAIHSQTKRSRLLIQKGDDIEFQYRYESWVRMASIRPGPRIDLTSLAEQLNREEGGTHWIFEGVDQFSPRLYRKENGLGKTDSQRFTKLLEQELRTGKAAWDPYD